MDKVEQAYMNVIGKESFDVEQLKELCGLLLGFEFNVVDYTNGSPYKSNGDSDGDLIGIYRLQSAEDTLKFRCGTSLDISLCALTELLKRGFHAYPVWYEVLGNDTKPNHMFIAVEMQDGLYSFEPSWPAHGGVHGPYVDISEICRIYGQWQRETGDVGVSTVFHRIERFPETGSTYDEIFIQARNNPVIFS